MSDISLVEFTVYGFVCYSSLLMLIISVIKADVPVGRALAGLRSIFLMPGVIASGMLAYSGVNIIIQSANVTTIKDLNSSTIWTNSQAAQVIALQSPLWQTFHFMIMIILVIYILVNVFNIIGKPE